MNSPSKIEADNAITTVYMRPEGTIGTQRFREDIHTSCAADLLRELADDYKRSGWIVKHDQDARTLAIDSPNPLQAGAAWWY
jgi:hypothetical protein